MQRGGSWDNSDVKGARQLQWSKTDKKYANISKSAAATANTPSFDWTGTQPRKGGPAGNKSNNVQPKKLFGIF